MPNLSESPLAEYLRNDEPENNWDDIPDTLIQWPENVLTDLGRATLAALSLPDAGEPVVETFDGKRQAKWVLEGQDQYGRFLCTSVFVQETHNQHGWFVRVFFNQALEVEGCDEARLVAIHIAAHALAEQWRAEREAKV